MLLVCPELFGKENLLYAKYQREHEYLESIGRNRSAASWHQHVMKTLTAMVVL
jgi:hypothetical protein